MKKDRYQQFAEMTNLNSMGPQPAPFQIYLDDPELQIKELSESILMINRSGWEENNSVYHKCGKWFCGRILSDKCTVCSEEVPKNLNMVTQLAQWKEDPDYDAEKDYLL